MEKLPSILLVDDDPTTNYLNERLLLRLGAAEQVFTAQDGGQALAVLTQQAQASPPAAPALILLDLNMPGLHGLEFLTAYQQLPAAQTRPSVLVVLTTSFYALDRQRVQAFSAVSDYLSKPLTAEKVQALWRKHFALPRP